MKIFFFLITSTLVFCQINNEIGTKNQKKQGFFNSPKTLFNNAPELKDSIIAVLKSSFKSEKTTNSLTEKIYFKNNNPASFAYSDGNSIFFNANNYQDKANYYIKTIRWNNYYLFEETFVNFSPGGFSSFGIGLGGVNNIGFNASINVRKMYCFFNNNNEEFGCVEKSVVRSRIRKENKELIKKFRKSNRQIQDLINVLDEMNQKEATLIEKILAK